MPSQITMADVCKSLDYISETINVVHDALGAASTAEITEQLSLVHRWVEEIKDALGNLPADTPVPWDTTYPPKPTPIVQSFCLRFRRAAP